MADITMKVLINNIVTFLEAGVTGGTITAGTKIIKGIQNDITQVADKHKTYVAIDDGGERTEIEGKSSEAQDHFYIVAVEIGARDYNSIEDSLDRLLDLTQGVKDTFELETNRQADGMVFGISITPLVIAEDRKYFWRGRQVIIEYRQLEPRYAEF